MVGNAMCDDAANTEECGWDNFECCNILIQRGKCSDCKCHTSGQVQYDIRRGEWFISNDFEVKSLDWQCCLADGSNTAHRILIFSIVMDANNSFFMKFIATGVPTIFGYIISVLAMVC